MHAAIFSHYDPHGIIDDYVIHSLRCYRQYFDWIVFVSTSPLNGEQLSRSKMFADVTICRENVGYDFGSWKRGFESLRIADFNSIAFINDSTYGPCADIGPFMDQCALDGCDLWGASINHQFSSHVQSYFMVFKENLLRSGFADRFWSRVHPIADKSELIARFEIGLSQAALSSGFTIGAAVDLQQITKSTRRVVLEENGLDSRHMGCGDMWEAIMTDLHPNPTQLFWGEMLRLDAPFIKTELFKANPMGVCQASILNKLRRTGWYDTSLIKGHVARLRTRSEYDRIFKI